MGHATIFAPYDPYQWPSVLALVSTPTTNLKGCFIMSQPTILEEIENLSHRLGGSLTSIKGQFDLTFDLRNLGFERHTIVIQEDTVTIKGVCEMFAGTSDKPSYFAGNTAK